MSESVESDGDLPRAKRARRSHVTRACDSCRNRKSKCTGETPMCYTCERLGHDCVYSVAVDGRQTDKTVREENVALRQRVHELEQALNCLNPGAPSAMTVGLLSTSQNALRIGQLSMPAGSSEEPFPTGSLVLSTAGELGLSREATFYRPVDLRDGCVGGFGGRKSGPSGYTLAGICLPGYLAPHLPYPISEAHHRHLLDLCFDLQLSFGLNAYKSQFFAAMDADSTQRGLYYSPALHLACLGIGWRFCRDQSLVALYAADATYETRGQTMINCAKRLLEQETGAPELSTIMAVMALAIFCVGVRDDRAAHNYHSISLFLAQDFRIHRRCDQQLRAIGLEVGSEMDLARRDVHGFVRCLSTLVSYHTCPIKLTYSDLGSWWATYFARPGLALLDVVDQREPGLREDAGNGDSIIVSRAFQHHCRIASIGHKIFHCNHVIKTAIENRVDIGGKIMQELVQWEAELPEDLRWPPTGPHLMLPSLVTMHLIYESYLIILHRPYILELGDVGARLPHSLDVCIAATNRMVDQCRYIESNHGLYTAPLSFQHLLFVAGTMLVLQSAGMHGVGQSDAAAARANLTYIQRALVEYSSIWPTALLTADSLRRLEGEYCPDQ